MICDSPATGALAVARGARGPGKHGERSINDINLSPETASPEDHDPTADGVVVGGSRLGFPGAVCVERCVLDQTVGRAREAFQAILSHWGFDVGREAPRWNGKVVDREAQEEMLMRTVSMASEEQRAALMGIFKHLSAWGFHLVPNRPCYVECLSSRAADRQRATDEQGNWKEWKEESERDRDDNNDKDGALRERERLDRRKGKKRRGRPVRKLNAEDFEAAVALDALHCAQRGASDVEGASTGSSEGGGAKQVDGEDFDELMAEEVVSHVAKKPKKKATARLTYEQDKTTYMRRYGPKQLTLKKKELIVSDTLEWCRRIAAYPRAMDVDIDAEKVARLARISQSVVHATQEILKSIQLVKLAATLPANLGATYYSMKVSMERVARVGEALAHKGLQARLAAWPRKTTRETIEWCQAAATLPIQLVMDEENVKRVERVSNSLASIRRQAWRTRFHCPAPDCRQSFSSLWQLQAHYRAPIKQSWPATNCGHAAELPFCPKCGESLHGGKQYHIRCPRSDSNVRKPRGAT